MWFSLLITLIGQIEELPQGLEIDEEAPNGPVIRGQLYRDKDRAWLKRFLEENPQLSSEVDLSPELDLELSQKFSKERSAWSEKNLYFEIALLEIQSSFLKQWGARFGSPIDFDLFLKNGGGMPLSVQGFNPIGGFVDFALQKGKAKIHFKQSLLARKGRPAIFHVGGEFPVRVSSRHQASLDKISYGMKIQIHPTMLRAREVGLQLKVNVREPGSAGIDELPRISEKNLETELKIKFGESLVVAGFFHETESRSRRGLPFLSEIPMFGSLFSSNDFQNNRSEAYFLITPIEFIKNALGEEPRP